MNQSGELSGKQSCLLALEDGTTFLGEGFGAYGTAVGELVFNTSMAGYQEILTDPSYEGQMITFTYPEIGNYGTNDEDLESPRIYARGMIVRHLSRHYHSWRATNSLAQFLSSQSVIGISEVDTRAITRHIRDRGAMRAALSTEITDANKLIEIARNAQQMEGADLTHKVTTKTSYRLGNGHYRVAIWDFGIKRSILKNLLNRDLSLTVYPSTASAKEILSENPDGVFLTNGPGDPAACMQVIAQLPEIIETRLPVFGICLGHQLLALALGAQTYKLKFGHRGGNQPVKNLCTGKVEITCHNHGFAVDASSMPSSLELTHLNLNDNSVEGFRHTTRPVFAVQYHPESSPGPHDSSYLFDNFLDLIKQHN